MLCAGTFTFYWCIRGATVTLILPADEAIDADAWRVMAPASPSSAAAARVEVAAWADGRERAAGPFAVGGPVR